MPTKTIEPPVEVQAQLRADKEARGRPESTTFANRELRPSVPGEPISEADKAAWKEARNLAPGRPREPKLRPEPPKEPPARERTPEEALAKECRGLIRYPVNGPKG